MAGSDLNQVIAARSTLSIGLDAFDATQQHGSVPDGQFVTWLGQLQWARRLGDWGIQSIFRTDLQLSNRSLLPMEQCAVGGFNTVRGYRENQLVRDECFIASLELRVPIVALPIPGLSHGAKGGCCSWRRSWTTGVAGIRTGRRRLLNPSAAPDWACVGTSIPPSGRRFTGAIPSIGSATAEPSITVADREHKSQEPRTSVFLGPD